MSVGQICNRETVIVRQDDSIADAAKIMREYHVGSVVVVEDVGTGPKPVGILTDRDLVVEVLAAEIDPATVSVGDIMSYELTTAHQGDGLWDTLRRMRTKAVRRVPVVDDDGLLVGILSTDDLLELLADELGQFARISSHGRERERIRRGSLG